MSFPIDKNLNFSDVLDILQEGLLPTGSAIMDGESQLWPEEKYEILFYPEGYEDEEYYEND